MKYKKHIGIIFEKTLGDLIYTSSIVASIRKNEPDSFIHVVTSENGILMLKSDKPDYDVISTKFNPIINYDIIYHPLRCAQFVPFWFQYGIHIRDLAAQCMNIELSVKTSNIIQPKDSDISLDILSVDINENDYIIINNKASSDKLKEIPQNVINSVVKEISKNNQVVHIGLANETPIPETISLLGATSLIESLWLIKNAKMVVSIDNYVSHVAGAYNKPHLGIYSQYDYSQVGPIDECTNKEIINKGIIGSFNFDGCSKVTSIEIIDSFNKLKEKV